MVEYANINNALMDTPTAFGVRDTLRVLKDDAATGVVVTCGTATL